MLLLNFNHRCMAMEPCLITAHAGELATNRRYVERAIYGLERLYDINMCPETLYFKEQQKWVKRERSKVLFWRISSGLVFGYLFAFTFTYLYTPLYLQH
jgi:hypothetical protein